MPLRYAVREDVLEAAGNREVLSRVLRGLMISIPGIAVLAF